MSIYARLACQTTLVNLGRSCTVHRLQRVTFHVISTADAPVCTSIYRCPKAPRDTPDARIAYQTLQEREIGTAHNRSTQTKKFASPQMHLKVVYNLTGILTASNRQNTATLDRSRIIKPDPYWLSLSRYPSQLTPECKADNDTDRHRQNKYRQYKQCRAVSFSPFSLSRSSAHYFVLC